MNVREYRGKTFRQTSFEDYWVSEAGEVLSTKGRSPRILKQHLTTHGYRFVNIHHGRRQFGRQIHTLVAEAFLEKPPGYREVNHKDYNILNNHVSNLEWVTKSENASHPYASGFKIKALTVAQVKRIRRLYGPSHNTYQLAELFGVSQATISAIIRRKTWASI